MSIRTTLTNGAWQNIGTGPAIVQLISPDATGAECCVLCSATEPSGNTQDGLVLSAENPVAKFSLTNTIWANGIAGTCLVAVQPDVAG